MQKYPSTVCHPSSHAAVSYRAVSDFLLPMEEFGPGAASSFTSDGERSLGGDDWEMQMQPGPRASGTKQDLQGASNYDVLFAD